MKRRKWQPYWPYWKTLGMRVAGLGAVLLSGLALSCGGITLSFLYGYSTGVSLMATPFIFVGFAGAAFSIYSMIIAPFELLEGCDKYEKSWKSYARFLKEERRKYLLLLKWGNPLVLPFAPLVGLYRSIKWIHRHRRLLS